MGLSLWAGSSMQEQLVPPPTVKSLQPSFQEVPKHLWEEAEGWRNCSGNPLAAVLVPGFPQLSCLSSSREHAVDHLSQTLFSREAI